MTTRKPRDPQQPALVPEGAQNAINQTIAPVSTTPTAVSTSATSTIAPKAKNSITQPNVIHAFHPVIQTWFTRRFKGPTDAQTAGWPLIRSGRDVLIAAPTGSGKT